MRIKDTPRLLVLAVSFVFVAGSLITTASASTLLFTDNFESGVNFVAPDNRYAAGTIITTATTVSPTRALQLDDSPKSGALWTLPQTYQLGTYTLSFWHIRTAANGSNVAMFAYDWPSTYTAQSDNQIVNGAPAGVYWTGSVPNTWTQVNFSQTLSAGNPALGKPIQFWLDQSYATTMAYQNVILIDNVSVTFAPVPEPSTCAMALAGLAGGGYLVRRRKQG